MLDPGAQPDRPAGTAPARGKGSLSFSVVESHAELRELLPAWLALFAASRTPNPFAHPLWQLTWGQHFVRAGELYVVAIHLGGRLVAVAPFFRRRYGLGRTAATTVLRMFGTGRHAAITELPQALIAPGLERRALAAIVGGLVARSDEWDWIELALPPEHGWLEPEWAARPPAAPPAFPMHKASAACVVLPLPGSSAALRAGLKRNVRESLRRGVNRLDAAGVPWRVETDCAPDQLGAAVEDVIRLHSARAGIAGHLEHDDHLEEPESRAFLHDVAGQLHAEGALRVARLVAGEETLAANLILRAHGTVFTSLSGMAPDAWRYGAITVLLGRVLDEAADEGFERANLSLGPSQAKLRWSERIETHNQFVIVANRRGARTAFAAYWHARAAMLLRRHGRVSTAKAGDRFRRALARRAS
ncbi:MAG TPA: GNAT family N-acetyltransferase [Solirubrobacteraceae bacterium]|jgi:CelD/BcsL family acetyltransferase involved in cellulose biosynthesis